jgi:hypothetical protein
MNKDILLECCKEQIVYEIRQLKEHWEKDGSYFCEIRFKKVSDNDPEYVISDKVFHFNITEKEYKQMLRKKKLERCVK